MNRNLRFVVIHIAVCYIIIAEAILGLLVLLSASAKEPPFIQRKVSLNDGPPVSFNVDKLATSVHLIADISKQWIDDLIKLAPFVATNSESVSEQNTGKSASRTPKGYFEVTYFQIILSGRVSFILGIFIGYMGTLSANRGAGTRYLT